MDGHLTTTQSGLEKIKETQVFNVLKEREREMNTEIRLIMSSQQTDDGVGLHQREKKKKVRAVMRY